mmetsp:Transcript_34280/g.42352  ORF Transcript_34280/g.42352 Transcript_34280/m.42352 type:complete len:119 (-) Transcript_34280:232-588(-)|eukprot:CAMPEP_0170472690 /NCGR_PEP_ID=MMETSP0123-20130129/14693_1 /TAXON_ID=182087 /ORGANISM="Favella ehrenbergii, Strain Fehren 1" /LENGTH=118 /DNA_ID=CAMNT_0010741157 /DNA_START=383 /DNA_END=739 /DNA_ORIENTATION=+
MTHDLLVQVFLVGDFTSSGAMLNYLHHFLAIFGAVAGTYLGRFIGTLSNITTVTEITTPFVNIRWMLYFHGKVETSAYFYNGLAMTFAFGVFRILFLAYIVMVVMPSAYSENDFSKDP